MPKSQFAEFISKVVQTAYPIQLPNKLAYGKKVPLTTKSFYDCLTKICQLESLDVLCLNCSTVPFEVAPPCELLSTLFKSYVTQFTNYTEHFLLYYLY